MKSRWLYTCLLLLVSVFSFSQTKLDTFLKPSDTLNTSRRNAVVLTEVSLGTLTLLGLDQLWYADYPRSKFHTINDSDEWLQMDKLGHAFSAYQLGKIGADVLLSLIHI